MTSTGLGTAPFDQELVNQAGSGPFAFTGVPDVVGNLTSSPFVTLGGNPTWENIAAYGNGNDTRVPQGFYFSSVSAVGPFSTNTASGNDVALVAGQVTTQTFDPAVCPDTTDFWSSFMQGFGASDPNGASLANNNPSCGMYASGGLSPTPRGQTQTRKCARPQWAHVTSQGVMLQQSGPRRKAGPFLFAAGDEH